MHNDPVDEFEQRDALLAAWIEKRREINRLEAEAADLLAERMRLCESQVQGDGRCRDVFHRSMVSEYAAAGRLAMGTAENALIDAAFLEQHHPAVREAFHAGALTVAHVREIVHAGSVVREAVRNGTVTPETLVVFDTAALVVAENESPMRTRAQVREIAAALAGETVVERHHRAAADRAVTVQSIDDGLALLTLMLPEHLALAIHDRLTQAARQIIEHRGAHVPEIDAEALVTGHDLVAAGDLSLTDAEITEPDPFFSLFVIHGEGDTFTVDPERLPVESVEPLPSDARTIDQVRADLATDLLLAAAFSPENGDGLDDIQARIQVTVAASTLIGADDRPAMLDGHGPLHPDVARDLAGRNTGWSRLFLDAEGTLLSTDTYTPTEGMRRFLRARDQQCRFPGCRMPVHRCQIDHTHDHAKGGRTETANLGHLCTGHHALKHPDVDDRHRWRARQLPDGSITWTSPLGRDHTDVPRRRVMFV